VAVIGHNAVQQAGVMAQRGELSFLFLSCFPSLLIATRVNRRLRGSQAVAVHERVPDDEGHTPGRPAAASRSEYATFRCACGRACACAVSLVVRFRILLPTASADLVLNGRSIASYMDQARHLDRQLDTMQRIDAPQGYADADSRYRVRLPARCPPTTPGCMMKAVFRSRDAKCDTRHDTRLRTAGPPAAEIGPGRASHLPGQVGQPRRLHTQEQRPRPQPVIARAHSRDDRPPV
jgi:hypothetical protein